MGSERDKDGSEAGQTKCVVVPCMMLHTGTVLTLFLVIFYIFFIFLPSIVGFIMCPIRAWGQVNY